ncbi:unnamed protein product [Merluccius merluccius]
MSVEEEKKLLREVLLAILLQQFRNTLSDTGLQCVMGVNGLLIAPSPGSGSRQSGPGPSGGELLEASLTDV